MLISDDRDDDALDDDYEMQQQLSVVIIYTRRVEGTDQTHSRGCVLKRKASKRRETRENRRFRHYIIRKSNNNILQSKTSLNLRTIHNTLSFIINVIPGINNK